MLTVNGTKTGNYLVTITATSGSLTHTITITVKIVDFSISSPSSIQVNVGSSGSTTISLGSLNGFAGTVTLTNSTSPSGIIASLTSRSVLLSSNGSTSVILNVFSTTVTNYTLTITGTSGTLVHTIHITVNVVDFTIAASSVTPTSINAGSLGNSTITVTGLNGFAETVALSFSAPSGITCSLSATRLSLPPSPATSVLSCSSSTAATYSVTVTGINGSLSRTTGSILFRIVDFTIVTLPSSSVSLVVSQSSTTTSIHMGSLSFTGTVTLNVLISSIGPSASPALASLKLSPSGCACNSTVLNINAGQIAGIYTLNITATNGSLTHFAIVTLTVTQDAPSLTTKLSSTSLIVGSSVTDSATLSGATSTASGTVTYYLFTNGACTAPATIVSTVSVFNDAVPNSRPVVFNATGSYSFNATYSGDNNNRPASSPCEPFAVQKDNPTIATSLSLTIIQVGQSVTDSATLSSFFQASGTVNYSLFVGSSSCAGSSSIVSTVTVSNGAIPNSRSVTFNSTNPGGYSFQASYSGDTDNIGVTSGCEPLTVNPVGVTITTSLSAPTITVGGVASDSSVLHGQTSNAGGTVTYNDFANNNCAAPATVVSIVTVSNGLVPNSRSVTFNSSGTFSFNAIYSGDNNNNGGTSSCEPLTANKASPTISTTITPSSTITVGTPITDQATLSGGFPSTGIPGTVTYTLFSFSILPSPTSPCSAGTIVGTPQTVNVGVGNSVPASAPITPTSPGFYGFSAVYNGNGNNTAATGNCEPLTVNKQTPTITTTINPASTVVAGASASDQATITGGFPSTGVSGTVTYRFFGPGNGVCSGTPVSSQVVTVGAGNSVSPSNPQNPSSTGQYSFNATYSGDTNNNQVTSSCEALTVNLVSTTTGIICGSSVTVGVPTSCTVTVSDVAPGTLAPTSAVNLSTNSTGTFSPPSPCSLSGTTSSASCTVTYTPLVLGGHNITATYTGDGKHAGSSGFSVLSPGKHTTSISISCSSPILANQASACTATVTDTSTFGATTPVGSVGFSETGVAGSFNVTSCALVGTGSTAGCGVQFNSSVSGTASIIATYSGDSTHTSSSNSGSPATVTVNPTLVVDTPSTESSVIDSGQTATLSSVFTGGTSPYACQWLQKAPGANVYSSLGSSSPCTPPISTSTGILTTIGSWSFELQVTESSSSPVTVTSGAVTVTVNAALSSPTVSVSSAMIDLGQSSTLVTPTAFSGGTSPYVCQWLQKAPGAASYTNLGSSFACNAGDKPTTSTGALSTAGSWSFELRVNDAGSPSESVTSAAVSATVNLALTAPVISVNPITINAGQTAALSTATSFGAGTPTYACQWLQRAPGATTYSNLGTSFLCSAGDKPTISTGALSTTGTWSFELQVGDSGSPSEIVTSNAAAVTVNGVLSAGAISPSAPAIDAGQSIALTSNPSGGTAPYAYQWYSDGACTTAITPATTATFNTSPSVTSTYSVKVTDSASSSQCSLGDTVTVNPTLVAGAVTPSTPVIDSGQSITLGANSSGGTAPYHYQWYSGASASCSSDTTLLGTTATQFVSSTANTYYCYTVTDSAFVPATQSPAADLVTVDPALVAGPISPLGPTIDSGQSVTLISNPSGGTSLYSYQWFAAASCTSGSLISGAISPAYTASPPSTTNYFYKVTDSSQGSPSASQCSPGDLVTVNPALVVGAITPSNPTVDSGQSITLTSHASGGTPSLSYRWYSDGICTTAISGATSSIYSPSPTSSSTYSYKVTDSAFSATSQCSTGDTVVVSSVLVAGAITPAGPAINGGQTITLTANPSGGTTPYNYQWYSDGTCSNPISSATSSTYSTSPSVTTAYSYKVTDSAFSPASQCAPGDTVTVNSAIVAGAVTPPNPTIDSGQSIALTSHVSGGTPPFSYQWYSDGICGTAIPGATSATFTGSPSATTSYSYKVTDSAQSPASTCSPAETITVNPTLITGPVTPSAPTIDAGQSITLTSHASGGTPSVSYRWYADGACSLAISGATSSTYVTTPSVTTTYAYLVTDSAYSPVSQCSSADVITVNSALLAGAITPSSPAINNGQSIILSAHTSGGTAPFSYQWYSAANCQTGSLIPGITSATYSASPTSTTTYSYKATDSSQGSPIASSCSPGNTVTVNGALSAGVISPSAPTINLGQSITLTANPSSGTAPYSYQWYSDGTCTTAIPSAASSAYNASPAVTATYSVKVIDSASESQCSSGNTVTVNPALAAGAITPSSPTIDIGQSITLTASPSAGTTPYAYQWYSAASCLSGNLISGATGSTLVTSPTSTTTYSYRTTDSSQGSPAASTCSAGDVVAVSPSLVAGAITPSSPSIDVGQSATLTSNPSGGTPPYSYQWYSAASCPSTSLISGATFSIYSTSPTSTTTYSYRVADSSQGAPSASQCSPGDLVIVNPGLAAEAITPSSPTIDSGQSITLASYASGGTPSLSYQWYSDGACVTAISGATLSTYSASPTSASTYSYKVTDSANSPISQCSSGDTVAVNPALVAGAITPSNPAINGGQSITLTGNPSGGSVPFSYQWYSDGTCNTLVTSATSSTYSTSPSATTTYSYKLTDAAFSPVSRCSPGDTVTVNSAIVAGAITPPNPIIDNGQFIVLTSHVSGGTPSFSYQWYSDGICVTAISGATLSTFTASPTATTSYSYKVTDSAQTPASSCSPGDTVTVNPALITGPVTPSAPTIDAGQSITLTSHASGGTPSVSYRWYADGACSLAISGATLSTYVTTPSVTTTYAYSATDSAYQPVSQCSPADIIAVNPALVAGAITPSAPTIDTGQSVTLSANPSGGTAPYTYQWYSAASCPSASLISGATVSTYSASPTSTTTYSYKTTDSSTGSPVASPCSPGNTVTVSGLLSAGAVSPNTPAIDSGQSIILTANPSGGSAPYSYQWYSDGTCTTAIPSATSSSYNASPTSTATYSYKVTDFASVSQCSPGDTVTVNLALLAGAIAPSSPAIDNGQSIGLSAAPSAGTTPYGYQWFSAASCAGGSLLTGATTPTLVASPPSTTTYSYRVTDSSQGSPPASACSPGDVVTVSPGLVAATIAPSGPTIDNGQLITMTSAATGGITPYSYQWFTGGACTTAIPGATLSTYDASPSSSTTYSYRVTDSAFLPVSRCSSGNTVTVNSALAAGAITPSSPKIDSGQGMTLMANPSGGTAPYTYQWYSGVSASCSSDPTLLGTTVTQAASPTANTYYCYSVTDSAFTHASQFSITDLVTVDPVLVASAITPPSPTIDIGQGITLIASPSGGTGPYSYQWYSGTSTSCSSDTAPLGTLSTQAVSSGSSAYYCYRVTDSSAGNPVASATSPANLVTVNAALTITSLTATSPIDSGQSASVTVSWSGGTSPYTATLYNSASSSSCSGLVQIGQNIGVTGITTPFTQLPSGTTSYCASVTDGASSPAIVQSASPITVVVNPVLSVNTPTAASLALDSGQQTNLSATFSGGTSPYVCEWLQKAPGATAYTNLGSSSACTSPVSASTGSLTTVGSWSFELQVTDAGSPSVIVTSNSINIIANPAPTPPVVSANPPTIGAGQNSILSTTTSFTGGTSPNNCQWLRKGPLDSSFGNFGSSFACIAGDKPTVSTGPLSTSGIWSFELQVSDSGSPSQITTSSAVNVTVNGALSAGAIAPGAPAIDSGQSITLTANAAGGVPAYSYQWYSDGSCATIISSATSSTYLASPSATTIYTYKVTDSASATRCSPSDTITVNSALVAGAVTPTSPVIDSSQSITLTASPSGGTTPYSYQWYSDGSCTVAVVGAAGSTFLITPGLTTTYAYKLGDASQGTPAGLQCSVGDTVTVNPVLVASAITPSNPTIDNGQSVTLTSHASGGTPPISYQWYSDGTCGTSITGASSSTYTATPTLTSTYSYKAVDSAFSPGSQCSAGDAVIVVSGLVAGAITPPSPSIDNGQSITLIAHPSGGVAPYTYQWYSGTSATCTSDTIFLGTSSTQTAFPSDNTYYCYTLTDASSSTQSSSTDLVLVNPILVAGAVTPPAPAIDNGQSITLTANPSGGTSPYHYQWYSSTNPACPGNPVASTATLSASPATSTYYCYTVTDGSTGTPAVSVTSAAFLVTVNPALVAGSITPSSPSIDSGQSITLTANPSGGTTPYQYQWYSGISASCTSDNTPLGTASTQPVFPTSLTYYCYRVTDSSIGAPTATPASAADLVTVNSALVAGAITPSSPIIDSGQSIALTAKPSGGVGSDSYQWYSDGACTTSILSATSSTYTASPVSTTSYSYKVTDSATSPASVCSPSNIVAVNPALVAGPISPTNPTVDNGQSITVTSHASGGTPSLSYQWYADGTCAASIPGATLSTYTISPTSSGIYSYKVTDAAFSPSSQCSLGDTLTVVSRLVAGATTPSSPSIDNGQSITLATNASGGATPYSYQWYSDGTCATAIPSATLSIYTASPTVTATYSYKVTDSANSPASQCSASNTVTVKVSHVSGGTSPLSYQWYSDGSCTALAPGATSSSYAPLPVSTTSYSYKVTDSAQSPASACSPVDTVTVDPALITGPVTPSAPTINAGQSITLTSHASGGTPSISYQWYSDGTCSLAVSGAISPTYVTTPSVTTTYAYLVKDSAYLPVSQCSPADTVTVNPALVAGAITPSAPTIDSGQSITLNANTSGGTIPYTYQWYSAASCLGGSLISGAVLVTLSTSPTSTTTYSYKVTDSSQGSPSASQCSRGDLVTVNPALVVGAITPSSPTIDGGQTITFTSHASGGTPSLSYQWYSDGACTTSISGATSPTYSPSPTSTSTYSYKVTDTAYSPISQCSSSDTVAVNLALVAAGITPASPAINAGQSITLTANPSGGTTPYSYQWYSDGICGSLVSPATSSTYSPSPSVTNTYSYKVTDAAFSAVSKCSPGDTVTVNSAIVAGAITPPNPTIDSGQSITLTSHVSGGTPSFSYQWYSDGVCGTAISGATSPTFTFSPSATTSYSYKVTDSAYVQSSICSSGDTVTVNSALLAGTVTPSSPAIDSGQSISLTSHSSGGSSPLSYQWYADSTCAAPIPGATSSTYSPPLATTTAFSLRVTDSSQGSPAGSACSSGDTVTVNPALIAGPITPPSPAINNGQPITLTSAASSGTTPYSYQWYSSSGCPSAGLISGAISSILVDSPATTTTYSYKVTDSSYSPVSKCSSGDSVTVNPTLAARSITPSNPTIDAGQVILLTSQASGGTSTLTYQWYSDASCTTAILSATQPFYSASSTTTTSYSYKVTDSANPPVSECSPGDTVTVSAQLVSGSATPSSPEIDSSQSITLTANPSGGTAPYHYLWYSSTSSTCPAGASLGTSGTLLVTPTTNTYYCYTVTDSSTGNPPSTATSGINLVSVSAALIVGAATATPPNLDSAQSATLSATFSGGTATYVCQWLQKAPGASAYTTLGSSSACTSSSSISTGTLTSVGSWSFGLQVTDSSSSPVTVTSVAGTVSVNGALSSPTISVSPISIDLGQSSTLATTTSFSSGTSPYVCQWLAKAPGAASYSNLGGPFSCNLGDKPTAPTGALSIAGQWSFELKVTDNGSPSQIATSNLALTVKKASPSVASTLSSSLITAGGSVSGSAALTGGYQAGGSMTYKFFLGLTCTGTPTIVGSPVSVTSGIVPNSASQKFITAGSYSWTASYGGDNNNNPAVGNCQTLTVVFPPTLSVPGSQNVSAGSTIRFIVNATGAGGCNGVTLTSSSTLPAGATFDSTQCFATSASSVFLWTPTDSQAPGDYTVTFTATDTNHAATSSQVTIHVSPVSKAAALPIVSYSIFGVIGFLAIIAVALLLRRSQTQRRRSKA